MDTTNTSASGNSKATRKEKENSKANRRGSSSKSQRSTKLSPAANLLSPSTTSLAPSKGLSFRSLSPGVRKSPSIASIRQPQPTVAVAAPEVAVSMVFAERVDGAPLGSAEALLVEELNSAASAESSSDSLPEETQRATPNTSPSSLPSPTSPSRPPVSQTSTSSSGWFRSLGRSKGKAASSSVSLLQEQHRKASKSPLATPKSLPLALVSPMTNPGPLPSPTPLESATPRAAAGTGTAEVTTGAGKDGEGAGARGAGEATGKEESDDVEGLPPMLTITESFPIPFNESPAEDIPQPVVLGPDGTPESATQDHEASNTNTSSNSNPITIATAQSTLLAPASTTTPATSPPAPSSLSSTPRKRSWFYSSSLAKPAVTTPIVAPIPLSPPVANTIVDALIHPPPPPPTEQQQQPSQMSTTLQWEGISAYAASQPQPIPGRGMESPEGEQQGAASTSIPSSIDDFVPPLPVTPPVPGQPAQTGGIAEAALALAQSRGAEGAGKEVVGAGGGEKARDVVKDGRKDGKEGKDAKDGKQAEKDAPKKERTGSVGGGSMFSLSIPLLGRAKIALPVGVVGGGGEKKDGKKEKDTKEKDGKEKGSSSGDSQGDGGSDKGAVPVAPSTTSPSLTKDTSASTASSPPTTSAEPSSEPVQSQVAPSASDVRSSGVEAVKTEGSAHADGQVLDTQATSTSSKPSGPTSAENQEGSAYYSWWNYVGWGSDGTGEPRDKVGHGGSLETEERDSAKDAGVGSTVPSGETEREKASAKDEVTLTTTTTTLTTTLSSEPVDEGKPNAKGSDSVPSNDKNFDAGTSDSQDAVEGRGGAEDGRGCGKKGDGDVDIVGESARVGQGPKGADEGNKLEGAGSLVSGSDVNTAEVGDGSRESLERAGSGPSWLSPWAWIGTSTSTTTTSTTAVVPAQPEPASTSEPSKEEGEARDSVPVDGAAGEEVKEQKEASVHTSEDSSPQTKVDEAREPTATTQERELELPNPIEASLKENRNGWASFFTKQSLLVKAIGYGDANEPKKAIKRDENGVEVMDLDSDDDGESEAGSKKDDASSSGGESRSRSIVPKLLTLPVEKLVGTSTSSRNSSPNPRDRSPAASDKEPPAEPLTGDEDIKRKVASGPVGKKSSKDSSSGSSTPVPPSPSGSVPVPGSKQPQPPVTEKSKSEPVTPKRTASPSPSVTKKSSTTSSPPNLVLPTWADIFHTPPRSVVLRPPSPPVSPPTTPGSVQDTGVGTRLLGKTMRFMSGVLWAKDGGQPGAGQEQDEAGPSSPGGSLRSDRKNRRRFNAPHPLRRSSSGGGLDIASLLEQERKVRFERYGQELPKSWEVLEGALENEDVGKRPVLSRLASALSSSGDDVLGHVSAEEVSHGISKDVLRGCRRVVIIGVHGWFPGTVMRTVLGEPTGTSSKFANMMEQAIQEFENEHGVQLEKITKIPLEGEGTIERRVEKLYKSLIANSEWMDDLREADVIFVATHSQGSVVSTHLMNKLLQEGIIYTRPEELVPSGGDTFPSAVGIPRSSERKVQRVCCLALCGIHLGPLRYLNSSSLVAPYIQYFENAAARELFEFQSTESAVSKAYVKALENVLEHGIKMVYIASLNDQVVPIYSGVFTAATHPLILRALYIDGDAYHSSDFLSNLLVLLLRLRNSGIPDGGLLTHLSEATAGSLSGVGHSTAYEELATYSLAVRYLFMTNNGSEKHPSLVIEPFDAATEQNDYEIPWSLRDVIADERVIHFFSNEVAKLRDAFRDWHPKTTILRDLKRKLQPIQRLPPSFSSGSYSTSKL